MAATTDYYDEPYRLDVSTIVVLEDEMVWPIGFIHWKIKPRYRIPYNKRKYND